jgi:hypothetical protein
MMRPSLAGVEPPPSLVLSFQGANPSTDEAKVESEETRLQAQQGSYSWNMNFTFDVAIEEPLVRTPTSPRSHTDTVSLIPAFTSAHRTPV